MFQSTYKNNFISNKKIHTRRIVNNMEEANQENRYSHHGSKRFNIKIEDIQLP